MSSFPTSAVSSPLTPSYGGHYADADTTTVPRSDVVVGNSSFHANTSFHGPSGEPTDELEYLRYCKTTLESNVSVLKALCLQLAAQLELSNSTPTEENRGNALQASAKALRRSASASTLLSRTDDIPVRHQPSSSAETPQLTPAQEAKYQEEIRDLHRVIDQKDHTIDMLSRQLEKERVMYEAVIQRYQQERCDIASALSAFS